MWTEPGTTYNIYLNFMFNVKISLNAPIFWRLIIFTVYRRQNTNAMFAQYCAFVFETFNQNQLTQKHWNN